MITSNRKLDKHNLFEIIKDFPDQLAIGFDLAKDIKYTKQFSSLTINGMGGSALPGELIRLFLTQTKTKKLIAININRDYRLFPLSNDASSLNIFSSHSGNTEETLSALKEGLKLKVPALVMTSGGKLKIIAQKNKLPLIKVPGGIQPRMALGYTFGALLRLLHNAKIINIKKEELLKISKKINKQFETLDKTGKSIAEKIKKSTPIVYASCDWQAIAMIWKIMINENGKTPAFWNCFPELNHNEMVGFTKPKGRFYILNLKDSREHPRNLKRMLLTEKILKKSGIDSIFIEIQKGPPIFKIFSTLQLGCLVSYYLAIHNLEDPTPVKMVEDFKKQMD